jgi:hypothetical protein
MPTRRAIVLGTIATGIAVRTGRALADASQPATPVHFDVPAGACDCHTHIFGDPEKFPFFAGRVYTPEMALPHEMGALHQSLHIERVVIVTPSVYGTDNAATLAGMKARGAEARGVAVVDDKTPESELEAMHGAGVRGIRINLATSGVSDPALARSRFEAAIDRIKSRNWHVQNLCRPECDCGAQGAIRSIAGATCFRSFRWRTGGARSGAAGVCRRARSGAQRQSLRQDFRRLSRVKGCPRLQRRHPACQGADRRQPRSHRLGDRLAASQFGHAAGKKADRCDATSPDRRRPATQFAAGLGTGCGYPRKDTGRKSGSALRIHPALMSQHV